MLSSVPTSNLLADRHARAVRLAQQLNSIRLTVGQEIRSTDLDEAAWGIVDFSISMSFLAATNHVDLRIPSCRHKIRTCTCYWEQVKKIAWQVSENCALTSLSSQALQKLTPHKISNQSVLEIWAILNGDNGFRTYSDVLGYAYELTLSTKLERSGKQVALVPATHKRGEGIYYTPDDAVDFMLDHAIGNNLKSVRAKISTSRNCQQVQDAINHLNKISLLDPACGSGAFLTRAFDRLYTAFEYATETLEAFGGQNIPEPSILALRCLFGVDIDSRAAEYCALALSWKAHSRLRGKNSGKLSIFRNITSRDSLALHSSGGKWSEVFPHEASRIKDGFTSVVGNPPYASTEKNYPNFVTADCGNRFALFLELMASASHSRNSTSTMIVPLSLTFSRQFQSARKALLLTHRGMRLYHFDNMPACIFIAGKPENTNTNSANSQRVTILVLSPLLRGIKSTALLRWRTAEREILFRSFQMAEISHLSNDSAWPRIGSPAMVGLWETMRQNENRIAHSSSLNGKFKLYISPTARYFISATPERLSTTHFELSFQSEVARDIAGAAINSNLFYWFWRAFGDGFHVTQALIHGFPLPTTTSQQDRVLAEHGKELWRTLPRIQGQRMNAGVINGNANFNLAPSLLQDIDDSFLKFFGVNDGPNLAHFKRSSDVSCEK